MAKRKLSLADVQHITQLAQLDLTKSELKKFQKQLSEILEYAEKLNKLDTSKVEPTSQVTGLEDVFREDKPGPSLSQEAVLSGTKEKENHFFKIKAVLDKSS